MMPEGEKLRQICHGLRSPVAVLQTYLRASAKEPLTPEIRQLCEAAKTSLEKIKELIDQLERLGVSQE